METEVINVYTIYDCRKSIHIIESDTLTTTNDSWAMVG